MGRVDTVILDKTGTVTNGVFRVLGFSLAKQDPNPYEVFLREYLPMLAGVESMSEHLLARAVVQYALEYGITPEIATSVEIRKGGGVLATCRGRRMFIGSRVLACSMGAESNAMLDSLAQTWQRAGRTVAYFGYDRELSGLLAFGDQIKEGAAEAIDCLRDRGLSVKLVSGDSKITTESIARELRIDDYLGEATPGQKAALIEELQREGRRVAVVGDGVNDAPALAKADCGIALGTGADIAMSAAPIVLVRGSLEKIEEIFRLSSKTTRVVRQNLFWAFVYNVAGVTLGIAGLLTPIVAAAAMFLSSASVIANSLRLSASGDSWLRPFSSERAKAIFWQKE